MEQSEERYSPGEQAVRTESPRGRLSLSTSEGYGEGACLLYGKNEFLSANGIFGAILPDRNPVPD